MKDLIEIYKKTFAFNFTYLLVLIISIFSLFYWDKTQIHFFINQLHNQYLNIFFKYITYLGSGWTLVIIMLALAIKYKTKAGGLLLSSLLFTFIVQILKHSINEFRPVKYFELFHPDIQLYIVEGVKIHYNNSFPSGHTATAFAIFFFLAFLTDKKLLQISFAILALLIGFSRIYLSQHFLLDIVVGSLIGYLSSYIGIWWTMKREKISI